jgi:hypothetical protein
MKTFKKIILLLAILLMIAFKGITKTEQVELSKVSYDVIAVHELVLKPDTDAKAFETFVNSVIAPVYNKMEGQHFVLVKGDRGEHTNNYAIILTFDSVAARDKIYPPSGGMVGDFGPDENWEKLEAMLATNLGEIHTDYIKVED